MARVRGATRAEREAAREEIRQSNRTRYMRDQAIQAPTGHQLVVVATQAAKAASRRITDPARRALARAIAEAVEAADTPRNRKDRP